jgi:hypothetical protein
MVEIDSGSIMSKMKPAKRFFYFARYYYGWPHTAAVGGA